MTTHKPSQIDTLLSKAAEKLESFEDFLATAADETKLQTHLGVKEIEQHWQVAEENVREQIAKLNAVGQKVQQGIDEARLQTHLGKSEAKDAIQRSRESLERLERKLKGMETKAKGEMAGVLGRVANACNSLGSQLR